MRDAVFDVRLALADKTVLFVKRLQPRLCADAYGLRAPVRLQGAHRLAHEHVAQPAGAPHPGMVWVPGGTFAFGDTVYPEEQPVRTTTVAGFWMDRTEVTNAQFRRFVEAAKSLESCPLYIDDTPALPISQVAARARRLKRS